jgi:putative membrane protein
MKTIIFKHIGFMPLAFAVFISCNDAGDKTAGDQDTLMNDTVGRVDNTRVGDTTGMQDDDAEWVSGVLESNYAEIALAQQAQQKATNQDIKDLAMMLEKDHTALVNEAKDLAVRKNWTVATAEADDDRRKRDDMMDDDVKEYQRDWLEAMEERHEKSIKKFEGAADDSIDTDLKTWINNTLPKLQAHHDRIMQVQKNMK